MIALTLILLSITTSPMDAQINPLGPGLYDQDVPMIVYSGITWTTTTDANNFGGNRRGTGITTSTSPLIQFAVWGDGFDIMITRVSAGGTGQICINVTNCNTVSWYAPSTTYVTVTFMGLGYGTHQVTIQKTSTTSDAINLDAIYVYPPALPPTTIPPTPIVVVTVVMPETTQNVYVANWDDMPHPEATDDPSLSRFDVMDSEGNLRPVSLKYEIDAGQIANVIIQAGILVMLMMILILLARRQS